MDGCATYSVNHTWIDLARNSFLNRWRVLLHFVDEDDAILARRENISSVN